jgi:hypothetical protein
VDALVGMTFREWMSLLFENHFSVDTPYLRRAAFLTLASIRASYYRYKEEKVYGAMVDAAEIRPPIFILGHWRNGTTLIHEMLIRDRQFAYPNLFQISHPHNCLVLEPVIEKALGSAAPEKRPMDNMEITFRSPGEDENALCVLSLKSPLLGLVFTRRGEYYDRYLSFRGVPQEEIEEWKRALVFFLKKLSWRYQRPIVLKSPPHTARIRLLLEMFPDARFIHVYRDPFVVFQSTVRMYEKAAAEGFLQRTTREDLENAVLRRYRIMYEAFFEDRSLIPDGQFHEVRFEDLERDKVNEAKKIYDHLRIPGWLHFQPTLEQYLNSLRTYEKNKHSPLREELRERIARTWARCFDEWGYDVREPRSVVRPAAVGK